MPTKRESELNPLSCWNKAKKDEPMFILLGRDEMAQDTIRAWISFCLTSGKNARDDFQIQDAKRVIHEMNQYQVREETDEVLVRERPSRRDTP